MRCPYCSYFDSKVIDSRAAEEKNSVRRRRECLECSRRFTTYETVDEVPFLVVKKDGKRERFERAKIASGLVRAFEKRSLPIESIERLTDLIEQEAKNRIAGEITSSEIGDIILDQLQQNDLVAYVRFASVYQKFENVDDFVSIVKSLRKCKKDSVEG
ncbi:MAG: transcriptional regulator NrdR [Negativicutes bacterium]|jgi:transcriptional repressor NrdR